MAPSCPQAASFAPNCGGNISSKLFPGLISTRPQITTTLSALAIPSPVYQCFVLIILIFKRLSQWDK